jgi:hypothetical protein
MRLFQDQIDTMRTEADPVVKFAQGYYVHDAGGENVWYYIDGEPPEGQYILRDGAWVPLPRRRVRSGGPTDRRRPGL